MSTGRIAETSFLNPREMSVVRLKVALDQSRKPLVFFFAGARQLQPPPATQQLRQCGPSIPGSLVVLYRKQGLEVAAVGRFGAVNTAIPLGVEEPRAGAFVYATRSTLVGKEVQRETRLSLSLDVEYPSCAATGAV